MFWHVRKVTEMFSTTYYSDLDGKNSKLVLLLSMPAHPPAITQCTVQEVSNNVRVPCIIEKIISALITFFPFIVSHFKNAE